ncbi:unnamed protein product [Linum tenue]|uniref:Uncharacterized protein n=1 Tax=Linum tenue TaxID=586396 RepID=A0AAV0L773_9ROSI|nr:unnamed protein product [Linum tenue]
MGDSYEEQGGENDPNHVGSENASFGNVAREDEAASVARDVFHIYDSDDA